MLRTHRFSVLLTLYFFGSLILFLWGVQQMPVTDPVESLYALTAKEMVLSGDWISPQVFGSFWYDKPPFMYWLLSASYSVFGFSNFASRLPAAFCGALSVSFMAWYVRRILNDETAAVWAAAFLATALEFWVISHAVITDSALFLFAIPTFFSGYIGVKEKSWKHITIAWAAAALACLTKGPVGLVLPGAILFLWCLSIRSFGGLARLFFPAGILVFLLIAGPWYYTMYDIHGQAFIDQFFGLHNVTRALSSEHPEDNYFFYYLVLLPVALLPWTGLSFYTMAKKWKEKTDLYKFLMIACWGTVLFYTLVATKYVTYTYIAVAPAVFLAVLAQEENKPAHAALVIPFVLTLAALVAGSLYIDGNFLSLYVIVMYSGFLIFTQWKKKQFPSMLILSSATMAVAYMCAVFGGLAAWVGTRSALPSIPFRASIISSRAIPLPTLTIRVKWASASMMRACRSATPSGRPSSPCPPSPPMSSSRKTGTSPSMWAAGKRTISPRGRAMNVSKKSRPSRPARSTEWRNNELFPGNA